MVQKCKIPKRTTGEFLILAVSLIAALITVAGKFGVFTSTLSTTPTVSTPQDTFMMVLGGIIFILVYMLWRRT